MLRPETTAAVRAYHRLAGICLLSGTVLIAIGVILPWTGVASNRPTGSLIRVVGMVLLVCFLFASRVLLRAYHHGWSRASIVSAATGILALALGALLFLHGLTGVPSEPALEAVMTTAVIGGTGATIFWAL